MAPIPTVSRRTFILAAAGGLLSACTVAEPRLPGSSRLAAPRRISVRRGGHIVAVDLEDYALGSALAEVSPLGESPAAVGRLFEVQAVLARSFAASHLGRHRADGFDVCDTAHCQLYDPSRVRTSRFSAAARSAVQNTAGLILTFGQRPAEALFHADCGGSTAAADVVWGGAPVPYLQPTRDACRTASHRAWTLTVPREELRTILNTDDRSRIGRALIDLRIHRRDVSGRAVDVALVGADTRVVRGEDLRAILNRTLGAKAILSTRFSVERAANGAYLFRGTGFGHGVGLCQLGAATRARQGDSLEHIFAAYFKGARLTKT